MTTEATVNQPTVEQTPAKSTVNAGASERYYRPNVDIVESGDDILLVADLPGARSADIDVHFEDGSLTLHARVSQRGAPESRYLLQEYGVADFRRTFQISEHIDASRITAEYHDGVLTLRLPKVEAIKPRKISVQTH